MKIQVTQSTAYMALLAMSFGTACSSTKSSTTEPTTQLEAVAGPAITENPVGFRLQMASATGAAPAFNAAADVVADAGTFAVTMAVVNLRHIELKVPEGWDCGEYGNESDDDAETEGSDEGTEDADTDDSSADGSGDGEDTEDPEDTEDLAAAPHLSPDDTVSSDDDSVDADDAVRVAACDGASGEDEIRFEGPFTVDLLTGLSTPSLDNLAVPPGTYTRVDLRVDDLQAEDTTEATEMVGHSLIAYGSYTTDTTTPVRLALKFNEDIRFETAAGFTITEAGGADIVANISAQLWFAGVGTAIAACLEEAGDSAIVNGTLNFDESDDNATECDEVEELLKESFKNAGELDHEDHDDEDTQDNADDSSETDN